MVEFTVWKEFIMAINYRKTNETAALPAEKEPALQNYDIVEDRKQMNTALVGSPEIDALVSTIEVGKMETVVSFGAEAADEIAKASDIVLRSMDMEKIDGSDRLLTSLKTIMDKFDIEEIKEEKKPGFLGRLFGKAEDRINGILKKYTTMGDEVDKIYVQLKAYEGEIRQSNRNLDKMFTANVGYYHELVKYILAGEQGCRELEEYIRKKNEELEQTGDESIRFEITELQQCLMLLEQRTQDLRLAEGVAMQSIPMIKMMEFSNMNLVRKIDSAFIITLPVFKQALAQAIMLKRQKIQAESLKALDEKTNEMLMKNARNTVEQSKLTAAMASGSSIKIETLENSWKTIVSGIEETKTVQEQAKAKRQEDMKRLEEIKKDFMSKAGTAQIR